MSHKFSSSFVQQHSGYMMCWTIHSWTDDAMAFQQLATSLMDAYNNFTRQVVDPEIALGSLLPAQIIAHDRQPSERG